MSLTRMGKYKRIANSKELAEGRKFYMGQLKLIDDQLNDDIPCKFTKIRCVCNKLVLWMDMYKCFYCNVWFCKDCAKEHFS